MASMEHSDLKAKILEDLKLDVVIVLVGEAGVGKTRLAKEVYESAVKAGVASRTLWLSLNKICNETSIIIEISQQLSLISKMDEMEDYSTADKGAEEENLEVIKNTLKKRIEDMIRKMPENGCILLVLDDVQGQQNEEDVIPDILKEKKRLKVLSTRRKDITSSDIQGSKKVIKINPLSKTDAESLLTKTATEKAPNFSLFEEKFNEIRTNVVANSNHIPATVSAIGKILNYVAKVDNDGCSLAAAFKELADCKETYSNGTRQLMRYAYELLPKNEMILVNCCWHCRKFFSKNGRLHYSELIVNWILEGCFGPVDSLEKAYEEGHCVLMKLIDLKMLKIQEDNVVAMAESALSIPDARDGRLGLALNLGLHGMYEDEEWKGFGRTTAANGMIKSISRDEKNRWKKVSTLLIDGIHLGRQVYETFFNPMEDIQHLILMNPKFDSLPSSISKMKNLRLLVLRGCDQLTSIAPIELPSLTVLEISGARKFFEIPESVFKFSKIQSLNFSDTGIENISGSLSNMEKLRSLVLRGCSHLKSLPKLSKLVHLIVIDLSGATSLTKMEDKCLSSLQSLQIIDLSQTQIEKMPILKGLEALTRVSLNDCKKLKRLRRLTSLPDLQVLELSGGSNLIEFHDEAFESKNSLKILDLSGANVPCLPSSFKSFTDLEFLSLSGMPELTDLGPDTFEHMSNLKFLDLSNSQIKKLPSVSNLPNLRQFILRDCNKIKSLPPLTSLKKLEVFDVSGCCLLAEIEEDSSNNMAFLLRLNLSKTKIKKLPFIVDNCYPQLQQLLMRECTEPVEFPSKFSLPKLEELDLSGTKCLRENEDHFFVDVDMKQLQILDLSGTNFKLKSLSNLINLKKLLLRDLVLDAQLDFGNLTQLEVLDLSRARGIESLPSSIEKLSHLRKLLLRDCSVTELTHVKSLKNLEVLDLWGVRIKQFPYWVAELEGLKLLDLPDLSTVSSSIEWEKIKRIPGELNLSPCASLDFSRTKSINDRPSILVNDTKFLENFELWGKCVSQFHIVVRSQMDPLDDEDVNSLRDEGRFRDIYFSTISFENLEAPLMKVIGFDSFPSGVKNAVNQAEYVSLIQNRFLKSLSELGSLNKMKGCWLQGCSPMASILHEEKTDGEEEKGEMKIKLENLEILWISSLPNLSAFYDGRMPAEIFRNLRHLYLDCCPLVETVFSSDDLPSNLEILQIKFCDKLKILFKCDETGEVPTLPELYKLNLIELPQLSCIGAKFPALKTAVVINCPNLDYSKESDTLKIKSIVVDRVEESWDGSEWTKLED